jgi:hypothetical protein
LKTLEEVVRHYNTVPDSLSGHTESKALTLSEDEQRALVSYIKTLNQQKDICEFFKNGYKTRFVTKSHQFKSFYVNHFGIR